MEKVLRNLPTIDLPKSSLASLRDTTIFVALFLKTTTMSFSIVIFKGLKIIK